MDTMKKRIGAAMLTAILVFASSWTAYNAGARRAVKPAATPVTAAEEDTDPLTRFRTEREQLRARQTAELNEVIYDDRTDAETVLQAQRQLLDLLNRSEQELTLEGVLQLRGFNGALVTVSSGSVNVLLRRENVTQRETSVILDLVLRETGVSGGNVKIIPVK